MNYREQFYNGEIEASRLLDVIEELQKDCLSKTKAYFELSEAFASLEGEQINLALALEVDRLQTNFDQMTLKAAFHAEREEQLQAELAALRSSQPPFMYAVLVDGVRQHEGNEYSCTQWAEAWTSGSPHRPATVIPLYATPLVSDKAWAVNYAEIHEYATVNGFDYNALCAVVRAALATRQENK